MNYIESIILGLLQGLAEFLPISSSGHLELGKVMLGVEAKENMAFTVAVHGATVLSTIVVFRKELLQLILGVLKFRWNMETQYVAKIIISMVPIFAAGMLLKDTIEGLFTGNLILVGVSLMVTGLLLSFTYLAKSGHRQVGYKDALIIGIAQAIAVIPGISRSGSTIATGLLLGNRREEVSKFSFLMVLLPIIGANMLLLLDGEMEQNASITAGPLLAGTIAAFIAGVLACKWMIKIVNKGKLIWFAVYCLLVGATAVVWALF